MNEEPEEDYAEVCAHNKNQPVLREMYRYIINDKSNILIGVTGRVGRGKSHTAVQLARLWNPRYTPNKTVVFTVDELMNKSLCYVKVDGKPLNEEMLENIEDVGKWLKENAAKIHITPGHVVIFDEAGTGAFVREFFSQDNKNISKVIQIWRFLRMAIFVIVPETMGMAEKNLRQFMDLEIHMIRVDRRRGEATAIAWEFYDKSDLDNPKKQRVIGCQSSGKLHIKPLPDDIAEEYESLARVHKLRSLIELRSKKNGAPKKDVEDLDALIKTLTEGKNTFKRPSKKFRDGGEEVWDFDLMRAVLKKPVWALRAAAAKIDYQEESGINPM